MKPNGRGRDCTSSWVEMRPNERGGRVAAPPGVENEALQISLVIK
jgi:hypothetical protein